MLIHALYTHSLPVHILLHGHHALHCKLSTDKIEIYIHLHDSSVHERYRYFWGVCMSWATTITDAT